MCDPGLLSDCLHKWWRVLFQRREWKCVLFNGVGYVVSLWCHFCLRGHSPKLIQVLFIFLKHSQLVGHPSELKTWSAFTCHGGTLADRFILNPTLHVQIFLLLYSRVRIESEVVWSPERIWTFSWTDKLLTPDGFEPRIVQSVAQSPSLAVAELFRIFCF
jgi:hypothetical protein